MMHLFENDLQHIIEWLKLHTEWSLVFIFILSLAESLTIIGSLIPGSVLMTMIGVLAGNEIIRIDTSLIASILGATLGDTGSYFLGFYCRERIPALWPFVRWPHLLKYSQNFFEKHGGKSVFLGRFIGPLRCMIPVIAGMMNMPRRHFFIANILSAIGWSLLYMGSGILIGRASHALSKTYAQYLIVSILAMIVIIWLLRIFFKKKQVSSSSKK